MLPIISIFLNHNSSYSIQSNSNLVFSFIELPFVVGLGAIGVDGSVGIVHVFEMLPSPIILFIISNISHLVAFWLGLKIFSASIMFISRALFDTLTCHCTSTSQKDEVVEELLESIFDAPIIIHKASALVILSSGLKIELDLLTIQLSAAISTDLQIQVLGLLVETSKKYDLHE